jgi:hypothetical protein
MLTRGGSSARLHHEAMEELAGTFVGVADMYGTLEFEIDPDMGGAHASGAVDMGNFRVVVHVYTTADALEDE